MQPVARKSTRVASTVRRRAVAVGLGVLLALVAGAALAAEFANTETYRLPEGRTVTDDLYVTAREVYIDGIVDGDLVTAAGYVEVNGVVTGDVLAAAGSIVINGVVGDDARLAGAGIAISGTIADDLFAAGGGASSRFVPMLGVGRAIVPGVRVLAGASITGDAFLAGETGLVDGAVGRNLNAGFQSFQLGGRIDGNAAIYARTLTVIDPASVGGTLRYSTANPIQLPPAAAADVVVEPWTNVRATAPQSNRSVDALWWIARLLMQVVGLGLLGWLLLRFFPGVLEAPVDLLHRRPLEAGLWGLVVLVLALPLVAGLVFLAALFWRVFPGGLAMGSFLSGGWMLLWIVSPVVTGTWLGRLALVQMGDDRRALVIMLAGMATIVVVGRLFTLIPCVGELAYRGIYLISLALTVGAWLLAQQENRRGTAA